MSEFAIVVVGPGQHCEVVGPFVHEAEAQQFRVDYLTFPPEDKMISSVVPIRTATEYLV